MPIHTSVYMPVDMSIDMSVSMPIHGLSPCIPTRKRSPIVRSSFHNIKTSKKNRPEPRHPKTAVRREHFFSEDAEAKGAKKGKKGDALGRRHN